jgi:hypothetical protein
VGDAYVVVEFGVGVLDESEEVGELCSFLSVFVLAPCMEGAGRGTYALLVCPASRGLAAVVARHDGLVDEWCCAWNSMYVKLLCAVDRG